MTAHRFACACGYAGRVALDQWAKATDAARLAPKFATGRNRAAV